MDQRLAKVSDLNRTFGPSLEAHSAATVKANRELSETWSEQRQQGVGLFRASSRVIRNEAGKLSNTDKLSYTLKAIQYALGRTAFLPRWLFWGATVLNPVINVSLANLTNLNIACHTLRSFYYGIRALAAKSGSAEECVYRIRMKEYWRTSKPFETTFDIALSLGAIGLTIALTPIVAVAGAYTIVGSLSIVCRHTATRFFRYWSENRGLVMESLRKAIGIGQLPLLDQTEMKEMDQRILVPAVTSLIKCRLSGEIAYRAVRYRRTGAVYQLDQLRAYLNEHHKDPETDKRASRSDYVDAPDVEDMSVVYRRAIIGQSTE